MAAFTCVCVEFLTVTGDVGGALYDGDEEGGAGEATPRADPDVPHLRLYGRCRCLFVFYSACGAASTESDRVRWMLNDWCKVN